MQEMIVGTTHRHSLPVRLMAHNLALLAHRAQHAEVIDIERRRVRVEELGLHVVRVAEGMRGAGRDRHVVAEFGVDILAV